MNPSAPNARAQRFRARLEDAIDLAIAALDAFEGDADFEPEDEAGCDDEGFSHDYTRAA
jgi:hypothetical protein